MHACSSVSTPWLGLIDVSSARLRWARLDISFPMTQFWWRRLLTLCSSSFAWYASNQLPISPVVTSVYPLENDFLLDVSLEDNSAWDRILRRVNPWLHLRINSWFLWRHCTLWSLVSTKLELYLHVSLIDPWGTRTVFAKRANETRLCIPNFYSM